ncbi:transmembrane protein 138 isoform X2 [Camponotus floridanus]|uniref:transmembrane protein 138 isoform X2 n=1 Tax=Camponotus floridanus TaxID=104421 RepID=UPI000DC68E75|nr:transmembrane protein 138 isoform X2 [Camponotus floridanus]
MSSLNTRQYTTIVILQYVILFFDICVNSFASFARQHPTDLLDPRFLSYCSPYPSLGELLFYLYFPGTEIIFQAGLIQLLYTRFRITLILCIIYMILSISLHTWHITIHWSSPLKHYWTKGFHILYSIHRTVLYYYFYKRASLRIGDPRFYKGSIWVQKQLSIS